MRQSDLCGDTEPYRNVKMISVGNLENMYSREIESYKQGLKLNKRQREIIIGLLLGDGHLETANDGRTYRLKVDHCLEQSSYTWWLYHQFEDWVRSKPKIRHKKANSDMIGFTTYSHEAFRFYAHQFYCGKERRVPPLIKKLITPQALAIWFMDDGSLKSNRHASVIIHSVAFCERDLNLLQEALYEKFGIETTLHKQKQRYWRIYVPSRSIKRFRNVVEPYIIPEMKYKLGNIMPKK